MFKKEIIVQNKEGLHARPATFFIQKATSLKRASGLKKMRGKSTPKAF